jgi:hypothetical protein
MPSATVFTRFLPKNFVLAPSFTTRWKPVSSPLLVVAVQFVPVLQQGRISAGWLAFMTRRSSAVIQPSALAPLDLDQIGDNDD